ncbi:MAG TPA: hypothetical protein H9870_11070 [Candidatus Corynebacterium avicola]|uniref:Uncharacterized protein n=1 Tax=Candidatus Corynebacterium avicola TaxID=2838527 RepID=A0A9D1ULC5_9CORY|nr:hypothetical protein [Candidatus Corynebacterium avicola]
MVYDDGTTEAVAPDDTMPGGMLARFGDGVLYGAKDAVTLFDSDGNATDEIPVEGSSSPTFAVTSAGSTATTVFYGTSVGREASLATVTDGQVKQVPADDQPSVTSVTVCDDGTTYWLDEQHGTSPTRYQVSRMDPDGRVETTDDPEGAFTGARATQFDCDGDGASVIASMQDGETDRRVVDGVSERPQVSEQERVDNSMNSEMPRSTRVVDGALFTTDRDGSYQRIPFAMGEDTETGQFDLGGGVAHQVTYDRDRVVVSHTADSREGDLEISTFGAGNPGERLDHTVVGESSWGAGTDSANDLNSTTSAWRIFPLDQ